MDKENGLDARIAEAREAGTSYGKLMAANYVPEEPTKAEEPKPQAEPVKPVEQKPVGMKICECCGKEFPVFDKRQHKYCSDKCRQAAAKDKVKAKIAEPDEEPALVLPLHTGITDREKVDIASKILRNAGFLADCPDGLTAIITSALCVLDYGQEVQS